VDEQGTPILYARYNSIDEVLQVRVVACFCAEYVVLGLLQVLPQVRDSATTATFLTYSDLNPGNLPPPLRDQPPSRPPRSRSATLQRRPPPTRGAATAT